MNFGKFQLVLLIGVLGSSLAQSEEEICRKDIIIVLDESTSINKTEYKDMKNSIAKLVGFFDVAEDLVRFSVLGFSSTVNKDNVVKFGSYKDVSSLKKKILSMEQQRGGTYLGRAIRHVNSEIMPLTRKHAKVVVWILTDGENDINDEDQLKRETDALHEKDVQIEVLGISNGNKTLAKYFDKRLEKYVDDVVVIESVESFRDDVIEDVKEKLCPKKPKEPEPICYATKDIIIALDSSSSVDDDAWGEMTKFVSDVVKNFRVVQENVRFDVFAYNNDVVKETEIRFTNYQNVKQLSQKILKMKKDPRSGTKLGAVLKYINNDVLRRITTSSNGQKVDVAVWVITDGKDQDQKLLETQSNIIRNKVKIHVLGITNPKDALRNYFEDRVEPFVHSVEMIKYLDKHSIKKLIPKMTKILCKKD